MENNPEQIPTLIFEWLEKFEFVQLPPPQQQEALQYFSKDEYMELRETMREIRTTLGKEKTGKEKRKQYLLERFDTRYKKPQLKILVMPVALWKVASLFLVSALAFVVYSRMSGPAVVTSASTNTKDTIYIAKETASIPEKIYDTIYIASSSNKNVQQKASVNLPGRASQSQGLDKTNGETIPVLSIKAMGHKPNIQKGNSMKDDSLLTRYTFVTL